MSEKPRQKLRIGVLVSGSGSNLQSIIDAAARGQLNAEIAVVISNKSKAFALQRAARAGIPTAAISHRKFVSREAFDAALLAKLAEYDVQWVALAGFMRVLTPKFLAAYPWRVVNIHPALLPAFPGVDAQRQAWDYGVKVTGCTVHFVDSGMDTGPIIAQAAVIVKQDESLDSLRGRILAQEHQLFPRVLQWIAEGRVSYAEGKVQLTDYDVVPADDVPADAVLQSLPSLQS